MVQVLKMLSGLLCVALLVQSCDDPVKTDSSGTDPAYEQKSSVYEDYRKGKTGPDGMYRSVDGNFLAKFPGEPEFSSDRVKTQVGDVRYDMYVYKESSTQSFMVSISEFPSKHVKNEGAGNMLQNAFNGALKMLENSSILDDRNFAVNGMPAKRIKAHGDSWHVSGEIFMVKNRLYQVTILRDGAYPDEGVEREFIRSFHILEKTEGFEEG